jgi:hypothetical protein
MFQLSAKVCILSKRNVMRSAHRFCGHAVLRMSLAPLLQNSCFSCTKITCPKIYVVRRSSSLCSQKCSSRPRHNVWTSSSSIPVQIFIKQTHGPQPRTRPRSEAVRLKTNLMKKKVHAPHNNVFFHCIYYSRQCELCHNSKRLISLKELFGYPVFWNWVSQNLLKSQKQQINHYLRRPKFASMPAQEIFKKGILHELHLGRLFILIYIPISNTKFGAS